MPYYDASYNMPIILPTSSSHDDFVHSVLFSVEFHCRYDMLLEKRHLDREKHIVPTQYQIFHAFLNLPFKDGMSALRILLVGTT